MKKCAFNKKSHECSADFLQASYVKSRLNTALALNNLFSFFLFMHPTFNELMMMTMTMVMKLLSFLRNGSMPLPIQLH